MASNPFYTIGHSTTPITEFVGILRDTRISCLVDVRGIPRSRTNSQYNADVLPQSLSEFQIRYVHIVGLAAGADVKKTPRQA